MELSEPIQQLIKLISPDGKSFDRETFKALAESFKDTDQTVQARIEEPTLSPAARLDLAVKRAQEFAPLQEQAGKRVVARTGELTQQADDSYNNRLQGFTNSQLQILQPSFDALESQSARQSDDYRYLIDDRSSNKDKDRELRKRAQTMNMIKSGIGGGLLLLDILRN